MKKYLFSVLGVLMLSTPAFSAGYGDAGCGLGGMIFGDSPGAVQIFAATTNQAFRNQAFGITSGTSGCDAEEGFDTGKREQEEFFANNFNNIVKEMAAGKGEHLGTLSGLMGCPTEKTATFASFTQDNFGVIYAEGSTEAVQVLTALDEAISTDPVLSASCVN